MNRVADNKERLDVKIPDQENISYKAGKGALVSARPLVSSRPALVELGNKLSNAHSQHNGNLKKKVLGPPANTKVVKSIESTVGHKENVTKTKKVAINKIAIDKRPVNLIRQESLLQKLRKEAISKTDNDTENDGKSYSNKQLEIYDPDESSQEDPQMVYEYLQNIFSYLRELEDRYKIREKFLSGHKTTPKMRAVLVSWLIEVHRDVKLCTETLYMCVSITDRYLQDNKQVGRESLQLVGTSALLIACKYEEIYRPELSDFVYFCDDAFTATQILDMEATILRELRFQLGRPLPIHFLRRYSKIARARGEHHNTAKYLLELALLEYELAHVKPSIQAAAACCLSMAVMKEVNDVSKVWNPTLVHYTGYKYKDFHSTVVTMANLVMKSETSFKTVYNKYAESKHGQVSTNSKLRGPLIRKLALSSTILTPK